MSGDYDWVKRSTANYLKETNGRMMNFEVKPESVQMSQIKDICIFSDNE